MRGEKPLCAPTLMRALRPASREIYAGLVAPATPAGAPPCTRAYFPDAGKVTKDAPRAVPFGIPWCVLTALFALAALRSDSRRATFCHYPRPICHFEFVGESVFFSPQALPGVTPSCCQSVARCAAIRGLDTANRALTTNNDNQGVKTFFSLLSILYFIYFFFIYSWLSLLSNSCFVA